MDELNFQDSSRSHFQMHGLIAQGDLIRHWHPKPLIYSNNCCYTTYTVGALQLPTPQVRSQFPQRAKISWHRCRPHKARGSMLSPRRSPSISQSTNHTRNIISRCSTPSPQQEGKGKRGREKKGIRPTQARSNAMKKHAGIKKLQTPPRSKEIGRAHV